MASVGDRRRIDRGSFPALLAALRSEGYRVLGPTLRDAAIVYDEITTEADLPIGWTDRQGPGTYRLERRNDGALFGYTVGPSSWKRQLFPARERLWTARRTGEGFEVAPEPPDERPVAILGARACEIAAIAVTDRVFDGAHRDPGYYARRGRLFVVAVQCGQAGATCFCTSMNTGPGVTGGFDLSLTEILGPGGHRFLAVVGSEAGGRVLDRVPTVPAGDEDGPAAEAIVARTAASMGRSMDTTGIRELLPSRPEHPRWEVVARRCLACTNCTMVCPTCFCTTLEDSSDLTGRETSRTRRWDTCFTVDFAFVHGGSVRQSTRARYRQWMTHKLATWHQQFGTCGCVGCGRCITWCPVGIDITEEVSAMRTSEPT